MPAWPRVVPLVDARGLQRQNCAAQGSVVYHQELDPDNTDDTYAMRREAIPGAAKQKNSRNIRQLGIPDAPRTGKNRQS